MGRGNASTVLGVMLPDLAIAFSSRSENSSELMLATADRRGLSWGSAKMNPASVVASTSRPSICHSDVNRESVVAPFLLRVSKNWRTETPVALDAK
jgi:hypothetical protein